MECQGKRPKIEKCVWQRRWENAQEALERSDMIESMLDHCHENDCDAVAFDMERCDTCHRTFCQDCFSEHEEQIKVE